MSEECSIAAWWSGFVPFLLVAHEARAYICPLADPGSRVYGLTELQRGYSNYLLSTTSLANLHCGLIVLAVNPFTKCHHRR
jgi:hypothetical protein